MPFKDIDFEKQIKANEVAHQLKTKIAFINKLNSRDLSADMKLPTIELFTGKKFRPKANPISQLVSQQEAARSLAPVLAKIDALKGEIRDQTEVLGHQHQALAPPPPIQAIGGRPAGIDLYERFGITDEDRTYYNDNHFEDLYQLAQANDQGFIQDAIVGLTKINKGLSAERGGITRRKHPTQYDMNRIGELVQEQSSLKKIFKCVEEDKHWVRIGWYRRICSASKET